MDLHPLHGKDELQDNAKACGTLADHGYQIELLPSIAAGEEALRKKWLPEVYASKNPDVRIDGLWIGDIKTPDQSTHVKKSTINWNIYSAAKQKVSIAIINLSNREYTVQDVKKGIVGALQPDRNKSIDQVWVITKSKNLFIAKREMVFDDTIYEALRTL
jgi:hypothetical protein